MNWMFLSLHIILTLVEFAFYRVMETVKLLKLEHQTVNQLQPKEELKGKQKTRKKTNLLTTRCDFGKKDSRHVTTRASLVWVPTTSSLGLKSPPSMSEGCAGYCNTTIRYVMNICLNI